jgi:multidrug resistance efflux pump
VLADGGELDYELAQTESEIAVAKARLQTAEDLKNSPNSKAIEELRLVQIEASEAIKMAEARKLLLDKFDRKARTTMLDLNVAEKQLLKAREEQAFEKAQRIAEAELAASKLALSQDQRKLEEIQQQLQRCKIYAPQAGIVLYAATPTSQTASRSASRTARAVIEEGAQVRERQTLIQLPDLSNLRMKVKVNESRIARVRVGQPAKIQCDAFVGRLFQGKVVQVSKVPEPSSWLNTDVRDYAVLVSLDGPTDGLRIGLTGVVEINTRDQQQP